METQIPQSQPQGVSEYVPAGLPWTVTSPRSVDPGHQHFKEITLADGATVDLNAGLGNVFRLTAAGNRTINVPTNPSDHYEIVIRHYASGGARTLSLTTGSAGAFRFGTTVASLSATDSGKTDYIYCVYNSTDSRWDVVYVAKGY